MSELETRTADGVTLRIDRVRAAGERRGVVVCLHAMMTDGRYFGARKASGFARALAAAGLDVFIEVAGVLETGFSGGHGAGAALNAGAGLRYYF